MSAAFSQFQLRTGQSQMQSRGIQPIEFTGSVGDAVKKAVELLKNR
jgi:hypothetical protein